MAAGLAQVRDRLQSGAPLDQEDRIAVLALLGLVSTPASKRERQVSRRNESIRRLARLHFGSLCRASQAARISDLARSYHRTGWRDDRQHAALPKRLQDRAEMYLWLAFKTDIGFPFSARQIDRVLK